VVKAIEGLPITLWIAGFGEYQDLVDAFAGVTLNWFFSDIGS